MRTASRFLALAAAALAITVMPQAQDQPKPGPVVDASPAVVPVERRLSLLPSAFTSFGATVHGGYLYVIGGHVAAAHHYNRDSFQTGFWRMSLADRACWEQLPGGVSLQSVALVADGSRLIRIGGMTALNADGEKDNLQSTTGVAAFDPLTRAWTDLPALPEPRSSHDAWVHHGKLYVLGGWKLDGEGTKSTPFHSNGSVLDLKAKDAKWESVAQPFERRAIAVTSVGDHLYAIGGMTPEGRITGATDILDTRSNEWSKGPELPGRAFGTSAWPLRGRVYATTAEGVLFSHAPGESDWKREATLAYPRMFHRLVGVGEEFAAIAGTSSGGHLRSIEWIKPGQAGPVLTRVSLPAQGAAKVRQAIFHHAGSLYTFGGNNSVKEHQFKPENFLNEGWRVNLNSLHVTRAADLPMNRQSFLTFTVGTGRFEDPQGFAMGGFGYSDANAKAATSQAEILKYDFETDSWETIGTKLPSPMTQFGHAVHDGKVYLFGGMDFDPDRGEKKQFALSDKIWAWDRSGKDEAARKEFKPLEGRLMKGRRAFAGAALDGKYYIFGGMTDRFEEVEQSEVFDFATGKVEQVPSPEDCRISAKLIPLNDKLYLIGGSAQTGEGLKTCRRIDVYDPATRKWAVALPDIGFEPGELQAFAHGQAILIYSAHNEDGVLNLLFFQP
ncbi:MAG: hypothetical protein KF754_14095 [Planctomycetes bacterium]|nr:hypothetical protein [Planctomycetota bacterium]